MTTPIVQSISDEQLAELEERAFQVLLPGGWWTYEQLNLFAYGPRDMRFIEYASPYLINALIARLRAAEADVARSGKALSDILTQVDLNIRPTVRDIINGMPDANDIYGYCERIEQIALDALENTP